MARDTRGKHWLPWPVRLTLWLLDVTARLALGIAAAAGTLLLTGTWHTLRLTARTLRVTLALAVTSRWRHHLAPAWLYGAALATAAAAPTPAGWAWVAAGVALVWWPTLAPARGGQGRRGLSAREQTLVGRATGTAGLTLLTDLPTPWTAATLAAITLAAAVPWWAGRRVRAPHPMQVRWDDEVAPADHRFAGTWIRPVDAQGMGVLELHHALASEIAKQDEQAEWHLNLTRGQVVISADPRLTVRQVRVAFGRPGDATLLRWWDGPTLQPDGTFVTAYADGALPIHGRLWRPGGAVFIVAVAAPGSGKGGFLRVPVLEAAHCPEMLQFGADGKLGGGLGYLRKAFVELATTRADCRDLIWSYLLGVRERAHRYGAMERDSFILEPGEPRCQLVIDELHWLIEFDSRIGAWVREITGTARFTGMGLLFTLHKGDQPSYGNIETRSNVLDAGWMWAGPMTDSQARRTALQGFDDQVDPFLPDEPGWCNVVGRVLPAQPVTKARQVWIPNRNDVAEAQSRDRSLRLEDVAPFGTVEDWLDRVPAWPRLNPATAAAMGLTPDLRPMPRPEPADVLLVPAGATTTTAAASLSSGGAGERWPGPPVPAQAPSGRDRILTLLHTLPSGQSLSRAEIAERLPLSPRRTSELLSELATAGAVVAVDGRWKAAP